ncbi:MAG: DUF87 domain-containing protein [Oscillospiraceae bacterium]
MKISTLTDFEIAQDHIKTPIGLFYVFCINPPNTAIFNEKERFLHMMDFQNLLDNMNIEHQIFIADKTESLEENRAFYQKLCKTCPKEFTVVNNGILQEIESQQLDETTQKAFYFIARAKKKSEIDAVNNALQSNDFNFTIVNKKVLISMMRTFLLREFEDFDIETFESKIDEDYLKQKRLDKKGKKKNIKTKEQIQSSELTKRLLPQKMVIGSRYIEQGSFLRKSFIIKNFPAEYEDAFGILLESALLQGVTFSMRLNPMPEGQISRLIDNQVSNVVANRFSKKATDQVKGDVELDNLKGVIKDNAKKKGKIFYVNIYYEIYGKTESDLANKLTSLKSTLPGITLTELVYEQKEGFIGTSPIGFDTLKLSCNNIPSRSISALYPFSFSSYNDTNGLMLGTTADGGYMFIDFKTRNEFIPNGSYVIIGTPGSGKSYLQKKIISQLIARGFTVFILDPEAEYNDLIRNLGGTVVNCESGNFKINPYEIRQHYSDEDGDDELVTNSVNKKSSFFQHLSWLQDFHKVLVPAFNEEDIATLSVLTKDMYEKAGITATTNLDELKSTDFPTLSTLYEFIINVKQNISGYPWYKNTVTDKSLARLVLLLKDAYDGSLSVLFNGHTNIVNSNIINFNIQQLLEGSRDRFQAFMFNITTYLWGRVMRKENDTLLAIDETHLLINKDNPIILKTLKSYAQRSRKYDAIIGTSTQQISDYLDDSVIQYAAPLFGTPSYKFVFDVGLIDIHKVCKMMQLTEGEEDCVKKLKSKQCLLKIGRHNKYKLCVGTLPYEDRLFGIKKDKNKIDKALANKLISTIKSSNAQSYSELDEKTKEVILNLIKEMNEQKVAV